MLAGHLRRPVDPAAAGAVPRPGRQRLAGAGARARGRRDPARDPGAADRRAASAARARRCSCWRTCTGPTTRRSTPSPCSGRRIGAPARAARAHLPRRRGAARPPAALGRRPRAPPARCSSSSTPLSPQAVASLAGDDADGRLRAHRRQPVLRHRAARRRGPPPDCRRRSPTRCSAAHRAARRVVAPAGRARVGRAQPDRHRRARRRDAGLDGARPIEPERRQLLEVEPGHVRFRHELARDAIRSSVPAAGGGGCTREILGALLAVGRRPGRHRPPRRGGGRRRRRRATTPWSRPGARRRWTRTPRRTRTTCAPPTSPTAGRRPSRRSCSRSSRWRPTRRPRRRCVPAIERAIAIHAELGDEASVGRCTRILSRLPLVRGPRRRGAAHRPRGGRDPGAAGRVGRAGAGLQRALADRDARRGRRGALLWGERALELASRSGRRRRGRTRWSTSAVRRLQWATARTAPLLEALAIADARRRPARRARALINLAYTLMCWVRPEPALQCAQRARLRRARGPHVGSYAAPTSRGCGCAPATGRRPSASRARDRPRRRPSPSCSPRPSWPSSPCAAATPMRRSGWPTSPRWPIAPASCSGSPRLELAFEWSLTTGAPLPIERFGSGSTRVRTRGG